ncbi:alcohol dehydrogenase transcription factor myb/SANT-like domain-containing protein [Ditylenchus destructor]|uniref:Alcohol dehydrogenase transcription factor myb/SANT-like domain-containing protein n=1 Tax=Ditylenchus destructor TaxID=166010 RepID=A0AAD4R7A2_9BILA|nr:alcohol dehydrogenase transcription factor myb/SANT-like domain-containing protein [Ditylenchus destructor]
MEEEKEWRFLCDLNSRAAITEFANDHNVEISARSYDCKRIQLRCKHIFSGAEVKPCPFKIYCTPKNDRDNSEGWKAYGCGHHTHAKYEKVDVKREDQSEHDVEGVPDKVFLPPMRTDSRGRRKASSTDSENQRKDTLAIIRAVRDNPKLLPSIEHTHELNMERHRIWVHVAKNLSYYKTAKDAHTRWNGMKNSYKKEQRRRKEEQKRGETPRHNRRIFYFEEMDALFENYDAFSTNEDVGDMNEENSSDEDAPGSSSKRRSHENDWRYFKKVANQDELEHLRKQMNMVIKSRTFQGAKVRFLCRNRQSHNCDYEWCSVQRSNYVEIFFAGDHNHDVSPGIDSEHVKERLSRKISDGPRKRERNLVEEQELFMPEINHPERWVFYATCTSDDQWCKIRRENGCGLAGPARQTEFNRQTFYSRCLRWTSDKCPFKMCAVYDSGKKMSHIWIAAKLRHNHELENEEGEMEQAEMADYDNLLPEFDDQGSDDTDMSLNLRMANTEITEGTQGEAYQEPAAENMSYFENPTHSPVKPMKVRYDKNGQKRQLATKKAYTRHISESSSSSDNLFSSDDENYSGHKNKYLDKSPVCEKPEISSADLGEKPKETPTVPPPEKIVVIESKPVPEDPEIVKAHEKAKREKAERLTRFATMNNRITMAIRNGTDLDGKPLKLGESDSSRSPSPPPFEPYGLQDKEKELQEFASEYGMWTSCQVGVCRVHYLFIPKMGTALREKWRGHHFRITDTQDEDDFEVNFFRQTKTAATLEWRKCGFDAFCNRLRRTLIQFFELDLPLEERDARIPPSTWVPVPEEELSDLSDLSDQEK